LHHWGASMMIIVVVLHMLQVFLFGAYKKPREATWMMGVVLLLASLGGGHVFAGGYLGGFSPPGAPTPAGAPVDPNAAIAIRNAAVGAVLGILIGLMGATVGGWFASGEPMHPYHYKTRGTHHHVTDGDVRRPSF